MTAVAKLKYLSMEDVVSLGVMDFAKANVDVAFAFAQYEHGLTVMPEKSVLRQGEENESEFKFGRINSMPGFLGGPSAIAGLKWIGSNPANPGKYSLPRASGLIILNDPETKLPIAIMDGTVISAVRTAASTSLAVTHLSKSSSEVLLLIGAGVQARFHLPAIRQVMPSINEIFVYDKGFSRAEKFVEENRNLQGVVINAVRFPEWYAKSADIIVSATTTMNEPIVQADWLSEGAFYANISGFECTFDTVFKADKIVVDNWRAVKKRKSSTVARMAYSGLIEDSNIHAEISEIIVGKKPGRENAKEIIYFNSVGMSVLDLAIAHRIYRESLTQNIGQMLTLWKEPLFI